MRDPDWQAYVAKIRPLVRYQENKLLLPRALHAGTGITLRETQAMDLHLFEDTLLDGQEVSFGDTAARAIFVTAGQGRG